MANGNGESGTERWVKWALGLLMPALGVLILMVVNDHVELAVLRSNQSQVVQRQLEIGQDVSTSLKTIAEQHQLMIWWQQSMTEMLRNDAGPKARSYYERGLPKFAPQ